MARADGVAKLIEATEKVINAAEIDEVTGVIDPCLGRTIAAPFDVITKDAFATGLSLNQQIVLICIAKAFRRGAR